MPEGVSVGGTVLSGPNLHDERHKPEPDADAPRGYTWNRAKRQYVPKKTGQVLFGEETASPRDTPSPVSAPSRGEDPEPAWSKPPTKKGKIKFEDVPQVVKDDVASLAGLVGSPLLAVLQQADPYCGTILAQNYEGIIDATLPLICRSEKVIKYFSDDKADWMLWGKLAFALAPVAKAVFDHHIARTVQVVRDPTTGQVHVEHGARGPGGDHLTPQPQPEYDPSAYAA